MKRVFPRRNLYLLCNRCRLAGIQKAADVQGGTVAWCWDCLEIVQQEKEDYKEELGQKFNECFTETSPDTNPDDTRPFTA